MLQLIEDNGFHGQPTILSQSTAYGSEKNCSTQHRLADGTTQRSNVCRTITGCWRAQCDIAEQMRHPEQ